RSIPPRATARSAAATPASTRSCATAASSRPPCRRRADRSRRRRGASPSGLQTLDHDAPGAAPCSGGIDPSRRGAATASVPVVLVDGTDTFSPALARTLPDTPGSAPVRVVGPGEATFGHANPHLGAAGLYGGRLSMEARIPSPLHPAIVHLPIGLALAAPFFAAGAMWAIRRGVSRKKALGLYIFILDLLLVTAYIDLWTREADEYVVDAVISERLNAVHEESGKLYFSISLAVVVVGCVRHSSGSVGRTSRILALAGT